MINEDIDPNRWQYLHWVAERSTRVARLFRTQATILIQWSADAWSGALWDAVLFQNSSEIFSGDHVSMHSNYYYPIISFIRHHRCAQRQWRSQYSIEYESPCLDLLPFYSFSILTSYIFAHKLSSFISSTIISYFFNSFSFGKFATNVSLIEIFTRLDTNRWGCPKCRIDYRSKRVWQW